MTIEAGQIREYRAPFDRGSIVFFVVRPPAPRLYAKLVVLHSDGVFAAFNDAGVIFRKGDPQDAILCQSEVIA